MALRTAAGTVINQSTFTGSTTVSDPVTLYRITQDVYEDFQLPGTTTRGRTLKWRAGTMLTPKQMEDAYAEATIATVAPPTGPIAGGTNVVVTGTGFLDASGATLGGTAVTGFVVQSDETIRFVAPAHAAGAVALVVTDDSGNVTKNGAFTYA